MKRTTPVTRLIAEGRYIRKVASEFRIGSKLHVPCPRWTGTPVIGDISKKVRCLANKVGEYGGKVFSLYSQLQGRRKM